MAPRSPVLLLRADASTRMGAGHAMRCFALAKAWQKAGGRAVFAMAETIPGIATRFGGDGVPVERLSSAAGSDADAVDTANLAQKIDADWIVADGYQFAPAYHRRLKQSGPRLMVIDDDGRLPEYCADVVLNQNLTANEHMYARREPHARLLLGTDYVLLRPEFLAASRQRDIPPIARRVLVTMGGSDPDNVTLKVVEALGSVDREIETTVVVGSGNLHYEQLCAATNKWQRTRVERNPANMAALMSGADVAVSAAGGTCWELAFLGIPMVVVVLARNQEAIAPGLAQRGIALNLGWHANLSASEIALATRELIDNASRREAMSEVGQVLIDGKGGQRVVKALRTRYEP